MNAALDSALPAATHAADGGSHGRSTPPTAAAAEGFKKALADDPAPEPRGAAAQNAADEDGEAQWKSIRWAAPHAFGKIIAEQKGLSPKGEEPGAVADDEESSNEDGEVEAGNDPDGALPSRPQAAVPPALPEPAADRAREVRTARSGAEAAAAPPGLQNAPGQEKEASGPDAARQPPAPKASEQARQQAADQAVFNRPQEAVAEDGPRRGDGKPAETMRGDPAKADATGATGRPETRVATAQEAVVRDPQAEIRVLSIQRAPAPAAGDEALVQKSAAPEAANAKPPVHAEGTRVLHTLKIELHPAELGTVVARMRMIADQLTVDIQVDNSEARHRLSTDSDAIVKALRSLGYDIDRVNVQQSQSGTSGNGAGMSNGRDGAFQSMSGEGGNRQSNGTGNGNSNDPQNPQHSTIRDNADAPESGLYI